MVDRRANLLFLLFLFAAPPVLAGPSPVPRVAFNETIQFSQRTVPSVEAPADGLIGRSDWAGPGLISEPNQANPDTSNGEASNGEASSGEASSDGDEKKSLVNVLFVFLAIAVVFEAAMSAIFDWRIFIRYFEGRGVKTPLLVGVALLVTVTYELDILQRILRALGRDSDQTDAGKFITALLISGGSSAVFRVYSNLGIRNPAERERKAKAEREKMAEAEDSESDSENAQS